MDRFTVQWSNDQSLQGTVIGQELFLNGQQLSAADGMTVLQNPKGLCHDSSSRLAINSKLHLFPSRIPPGSAGSYGPNVSQGCLQ